LECRAVIAKQRGNILNCERWVDLGKLGGGGIPSTRGGTLAGDPDTPAGLNKELARMSWITDKRAGPKKKGKCLYQKKKKRHKSERCQKKGGTVLPQHTKQERPKMPDKGQI